MAATSSLINIALKMLLTKTKQKQHYTDFWPAVKEVIDRYELIERPRIQTTADLNIVSSEQAHHSTVLLLKHLPLQRWAQQQEVVICREKRNDRAGMKLKMNIKTEEIGRKEGRGEGQTYRIWTKDQVSWQNQAGKTT